MQQGVFFLRIQKRKLVLVFQEKLAVNEQVSESDFVPLWDGTVMRRSLTEHKLLEGI